MTEQKLGEQFKMTQIKVTGWLNGLYKMLYFLMYAQKPEKTASVLNHINDITSIPFILFSRIMCSYIYFISSLSEQTHKKRIAEMLYCKNEIGNVSFACWLILNTIIIGYILFNYTLVAIAAVSIICVIISLSKINVKLDCGTDY